MTEFVLRARYVFPVAGPPIPDGAVVIDGQRIVGVGQQYGAGEARDLGNVAILPGLVNAHTHLDLSDLSKPLGERGIGFVDWIRRVIEHRQPAVNRTNAVAIGLDESSRCGVTTLGDIVQSGAMPTLAVGMSATGESGHMPTASVGMAPADGLAHITAFQELIAPTAARMADALKLAKSHLQHAVTDNWQPALSPHAPYSVHREVLPAVVALSAAQRIPVAMHLAESREELELLRHGTGPLRVFLEEIGAWDETAIGRGSRPINYLRLLASAHRALVIHGNYLDDEEMGFLAANAGRMSVVYCPRTHDWFAHRAYPLEKMLAAGVTVALGTDGRGSSPDLSLLAEMRFAVRQHPAVPLDRILQLGTLLGAKALGRQRHIGTLEPGKQADLAIVALPDRDAADPHELLLMSEEPVVGRYFRGLGACFNPDLPNRRANSSSTSVSETPQHANSTSK